MRIVGVLVLAVSASQALAGDRVSVTFINPGGPTQFWGDVASTMSSAAQDLGLDLEIVHTHRDRVVMVDAARALAQRVDLPDYVIIVNELRQAPAMLEALGDTDIRVFVLLNRMTEDQRRAYEASGGDLDRIVGSIVPDNEIAGYEMAQSLIEAARARGLAEDGLNILALLGDAATPAALAREAGLMRALAEHPDAKLVRAFPVMWREDTAYERTATVLSRFQLDAIWSANDQIALGAQRAAREAGETPGESIFFAGLNWSSDGLTAVRDGTMTMTHGGHFFAGAWSMVMIHDIANGTLPEGSHLTFPMSAVRSDTVERFLDVFRAREWSAIDFGTFSLKPDGASTYGFTSDALLDAVATQGSETTPRTR